MSSFAVLRDVDRDFRLWACRVGRANLDWQENTWKRGSIRPLRLEKLVDHLKELIVVGVDGGAEGDAALRFALEEAERTGDSVEVITAWRPEPLPAAPYIPFGDPPTPDNLQRAAQERQDSAMARVLGEPPVATVSSRVLRGDAKALLVEAAQHARLLVVGSRAMGPVRAVLLGSVSRYCAHHSVCPVVVVPTAELSTSEPTRADLARQA